MSPSISSAPAGVAAPRATSAGRPRIRQAVAYVALLVWGVPLAAFVVVGLHADATPCAVVGDLPCDGQGVVVITAVLAATLLIPLGLLAMLLAAVLATVPPARTPASVAATASGAALAVGALLWGVLQLLSA
ncbi:MAG: hypothetical protein ACXV3S_04785 [Kineosporiaceae bacterium]